MCHFLREITVHTICYAIYEASQTSVIATDAPIRHRGSVALFYRSEPHFMVEAVEKFGPNVLGFQLATGARRWYIVGVFIALEDTKTMERVVAAIRKKPRGAELMVAGDFNADIAALEGNRWAENIATDIATAGLEDMARHFLPRGSGGAGTDERGTCGGRDRWCDPGRITS